MPAPSQPTTAPVTEPTTRPNTRPTTDDGDHDRFAHYVDKNEMTRAHVEGTPVRALCGKVWVPSRDPSRYPVCPTCKQIMETVFGGGGDDEG